MTDERIGYNARPMRALLLLLLGTTIALMLAEGVARVREHLHCRELTGGFNVRSRLWGWGNRPGARGWAQRCVREGPEWRAYTHFNGHGLRDREIPYAQSADFRVLVLGDSFTVGMQVEQERTYAKLLEQRLNADAPPGTRRFEVLNAGVSAWGTDNALLFFENEGWKYRPDLVLLAFDTVNDVFENTRRMVGMSAFWPDKPYFALADGRLVRRDFPLASEPPLRAVLSGATAALERRSALFRTLSDVPSVQSLLLIAAPSRPPDGVAADPLEVYLATYPAVWREGWRITRGLILRLRQDVEARGGRFGVVIISGREEVSTPRWEWARSHVPSMQAAACDVDKPSRLMTRFLARRHIAAIPLLPAFRAAFPNDATPGFFGWDMHWAPAGHELAARTIEQGLRDLGLVPGRDPGHRLAADAVRQ